MNDTGAAHVDLLRHGEAAGGPRYRGTTDDPLTDTGWTQMWAAISRGPQWKAIITSPLQRCAGFARALAQRYSLELHVDARLREMNFGEWEGKSAAELMETQSEALSRFWRDPWTYGPPGGESLIQMQSRVLAAWHDVAERRQSVLLISHGGPIRILLCHASGLPRQKLLELDVPHAALHRLKINAEDSPIVEACTP